MTFVQLLCYGIGALCIGISLTFALLTTLVKDPADDQAAGCLTTLSVVCPLILGVYLIGRAFLS
jgi:hypothetical protein